MPSQNSLSFQAVYFLGGSASQSPVAYPFPVSSSLCYAGPDAQWAGLETDLAEK